MRTSSHALFFAIHRRAASLLIRFANSLTLRRAADAALRKSLSDFAGAKSRDRAGVLGAVCPEKRPLAGQKADASATLI